MSNRTDLLVVGAGPYAYSAAACARDAGIDTHVVGLPMSSWREQMPADVFLRSGPDWSLDATGEHSFTAFFEDRGLDPAEHDPIPISVFLDHTDGFPDLSPGFETSVPGLFVTGFASTRDVGPFYGFTKGCPSSATPAVTEMLRREDPA